MKTMKLNLILTLTTICELIAAQTYPPINNNSSWYVNQIDWTTNYNFWIISEKDTVVSSLIYTKYIVPGSSSPVALIREDVNNKKVYRNLNGSDVLMFNFTLQLTNTITLGNGLNYTVDVVDSINVAFGNKRRRLILNHHLGSTIVTSEVWIEGVGNGYFPVKPFFELWPDPAYSLVCSYQNGINVVTSGSTNCPTPPVLGIVEKYNNKSIMVSPNPFSSKATLVTDKFFINASLVVYNSFGQIVKQMDNISGQTILIHRDNLPNGLYFLKVLENNQVLAPSYKLIIDN
jgi:hypothetical protein